MEYPKIETLYERDKETFKVIPDRIRLPEVELITRWLVTEKIDGTNIRVVFRPEVSLADGSRVPSGPGQVTFGGKTDKAQVPPFLLTRLEEMFPPERFDTAFDDLDIHEVILYGEGYGARIQKGGGNYREGVNFRLFDVVVIGAQTERPWWLEWENVLDVARKLEIEIVPALGEYSLAAAAGLIGTFSRVAEQDKGDLCTPSEGVVARTVPMLCRRNGQRLMWKLKSKDFA